MLQGTDYVPCKPVCDDSEVPRVNWKAVLINWALIILQTLYQMKGTRIPGIRSQSPSTKHLFVLPLEARTMAQFYWKQSKTCTSLFQATALTYCPHGPSCAPLQVSFILPCSPRIKFFKNPAKLHCISDLLWLSIKKTKCALIKLSIKH